jgi:dTDP-4-amino-4,6-dideoxygalactose transaminase
VGNVDELYKVANNHNIRVIEDAAHAFGGSYRGKKIGAFGDIACFSFDGIKNITSGEGGCVVTNDEEIINSVKNARLLGVEGDSEKRFSNSRSWEFDVKKQGWRYHMSDVMAAIGIEQLKKLPEFSDKRRKIAIKYDKLLFNIDGIEYLSQNYSEVVPHIYPVLIKNIKNKEGLRENLLKKGIQTGIHYFPNHYLSLYKTAYRLKIVEEVYEQIISLPLHPDLTDDDLDFIATTLINEIKINRVND